MRAELFRSGQDGPSFVNPISVPTPFSTRLGNASVTTAVIPAPAPPAFSPRVWEMQQEQARQAAATAAAARTALALIAATTAQAALDEAAKHKAGADQLAQAKDAAANGSAALTLSVANEMRVALGEGSSLAEAAALARKHGTDDAALKQAVDAASAVVRDETPERRQLELQVFRLQASQADVAATQGTPQGAAAQDEGVAAQGALRAALVPEVELALKNAQAMAGSDASINDPARDVAKRDPLAVAAAKLSALHPDEPVYQGLLGEVVATRRLYGTQAEVDRLMGGAKPDPVQALKVLNTGMDAAPTAAERQKIFDAAGAPHFNRAFFKKHIGELTDTRARSADGATGAATMLGDVVGQWLKPLMAVAPDKVAKVALAVLNDEMDGSWSANVNNGSSLLTAGVDLYAALSLAVHASGSAEWADKIALKLTAGAKDKQDLLRVLMQGSQHADLMAHDTVQTAVQRAVGDGDGTELSVALQNALGRSDPYGLRDQVLEGIAGGVDDLKKNTTGAMEKVYSPSARGSAGGDLTYYLANFVDRKDPAAVAAAISDYRRMNPDDANRLDEAARVAGDWGLKVHDAQVALGTLETAHAKPTTRGEKALDAAWSGLEGDDQVTSALLESPQLQQKLFNDAKLDAVPFKADGVEVLNYGAFIARHTSNLAKLTLGLHGRSQLAALFANPAQSPDLVAKFEKNYSRLAEKARVPRADITAGFDDIKRFWHKAAGVDANAALSVEQKASAYKTLRAGLEGQLAARFGGKITTGAVMDPTDVRKGIGKLLAGVADIGFVTHNIATPLTLLAGEGRGFNVVYQLFQPAFLAKPFVNAISVIKGANLSALSFFKGGFGVGALGVAIGDGVLTGAQFDEVPTWVTATNAGMAVGGAMDGIASLLALRGMAVPGWISPWGGALLAVSCILKMSYNIANRLEVVNRYESQNNDVLTGLLKEQGFSDKQRVALLDANQNGTNVMQGMQQMADKHGVPFDNLVSYLKKNLTDDKIGGPNDLTHQVHHLMDEHMGNDGVIRATDPEAAGAGRWSDVAQTRAYGMGSSVTVQVPAMQEVESLDGLYAYMERTLGRFDKTAAAKPAPPAAPAAPLVASLPSLFVPTPPGGSIWKAAKDYQKVILPPLQRDSLAGETADFMTHLASDELLKFNPGKQRAPDDLAVGELLRLGPALG